ncbi:MAG: hypothetical protein PVJ57_17435 [Phycisphaerae bacterium]|jgi:hypothetical protein
MKTMLLKRVWMLTLLAGLCLPATVTCEPDYGYYDGYYYEDEYYYDDDYYEDDGWGYGSDWWLDFWW